MGNTPSLPGLGGGRTHVKRDMAKDDRKAELRPENLSASGSESELSDEGKDEQFDREFREKLTRGTNRKSRNEVAQRSSFSHNGARAVGQKCSVMEDEAIGPIVSHNSISKVGQKSSDRGDIPMSEAAKAVESERPLRSGEAIEVNAVVNNGSGRRNETLCKKVTSSEHEQRERDVNRPVHVREISRRSDNQSQSDSSSDESVCPSDRRSPEELDGRGLTELSGRGICELGRHRISE